MPAFLLPDLGEGLTEAEVVTWHVRVGDTVTIDQNVVEVETAKAMVEVPVPFAGQVTELHAFPGDVVAVGQPLVTVEAAETHGEGGSGKVLIGSGTPAARPRRRRGMPPAAPPAVPPPVSRPAVASPLLRKLARDTGVDLTAIRGSGRDGLIIRRDVDAAIKNDVRGTGARRAYPDPAEGAAQGRRRQVHQVTAGDPGGHDLGGRGRDRDRASAR